MRFQIVPISEDHLAGFHAVFDSAAREARYLGRIKAPPIESTQDWVRGSIRIGLPQFVALVDNRVLGWCDVKPDLPETMAHSGVLGMGIVEGFREQGIGDAPMRATLARAREIGLTRMELTVREDNLRAKALYEKVGFVVEGVKRKAALHDGKYYGLILMGLLL